MAARPAPLSTLRVCTRLAKNSVRRLEASIECSQYALRTNMRLTPSERAHYQSAIDCALEMVEAFQQLADMKLPKAPPKTKKRIGRPSNAEIARNEAARKKERRGRG